MNSTDGCLAPVFITGALSIAVQTIVCAGVALAVYVAIRRRIWRAQRSRRQSILAIAETVKEHARRIGLAVLNTDSDFPLALAKTYNKTSMAMMTQALAGVPLADLGSRDGVLALLSLREQFVFLEAAVDMFIGGPWKESQLRKPTDSSNLELQSAVEGRVVLARNVQLHVSKLDEAYSLLHSALDRYP